MEVGIIASMSSQREVNITPYKYIYLCTNTNNLANMQDLKPVQIFVAALGIAAAQSGAGVTFSKTFSKS